MKGLKNSKVILGIFGMILGLSLVMASAGLAKDPVSGLMDDLSKMDQGKAALTNIAGVWNLSVDWDCNGSPFYTTWTIDQTLIFLKFVSGTGNSGLGLVWKNKVALKYQTGDKPLYIGTLSNNNTYMSGTMKDPVTSTTGCFTATKTGSAPILEGPSDAGDAAGK